MPPAAPNIPAAAYFCQASAVHLTARPNTAAMPAPAPSSKPRVVKDYEKLDEAVVEQIKLAYPLGFRNHLVTFKNAQGDTVSALPFETDERYYLVRMTVKQAVRIIEEDDDYDDDGNLKPKVKRAYAAKHDDDEEDDGDDDLAGIDGDLSFDDDEEFGDGDDDDEGNGGPGSTVSLDGVDVVDPSTT